MTASVFPGSQPLPSIDWLRSAVCLSLPTFQSLHFAMVTSSFPDCLVPPFQTTSSIQLPRRSHSHIRIKTQPFFFLLPMMGSPDFHPNKRSLS